MTNLMFFWKIFLDVARVASGVLMVVLSSLTIGLSLLIFFVLGDWLIIEIIPFEQILRKMSSLYPGMTTMTVWLVIFLIGIKIAYYGLGDLFEKISNNQWKGLKNV